MLFYYSPYILLPLASALLNAGLAAFAWRRRRLAAARGLFWVMAAMSGWSLSYALNTAALDLSLKVFFLKSAIACVCLLLPSLLAFALETAGLGSLVTPRRLFLVSLLPAVSVFGIWSSELHTLHAHGYVTFREGPLLLLGYREGPLFVLHSAYARLITLASIAVFASGLWRLPKSERFRFVVLLLATCVPFVVNVLSRRPGSSFNYSTSTLFFSGICYALAVFRYRLLDLMPLARTALFDQIGEPVLVFNDHRELVDCNDAARLLAPEGAESSLESLQRNLLARFPLLKFAPDRAESFEHNLSDALDPRRFWRVASWALSAGAIKGRLVLLHDVSDLKRTELSLTESQRHLWELNATLKERVEEETRRRVAQERLLANQARLAAMGEMIGVIAHQWRQPLATLGMMVQRLHAVGIRQGVTAEGLDEFKANAMRQVYYMSDTIEEFRDFYRPEKERVFFSPHDCIADSVKLFDPQFATCAIKVETSAGEGALRSVSGFPNEFKQVVLNLLSNARDAILARRKLTGGPEVGEIRVRLWLNGEKSLAIEVSDNGCGIPEEIAERIFDPYFTTKEESGGTGIGLYMSRMIVNDSLGGRLSLLHGREGAAFHIELPLEDGL